MSPFMDQMNFFLGKHSSFEVHNEVFETFFFWNGSERFISSISILIMTSKYEALVFSLINKYTEFALLNYVCLKQVLPPVLFAIYIFV